MSTIQEFEQKAKALRELDEQITIKKAELSSLYEAWSVLESEILAMLEIEGKHKYHSEHGVMSRATRTSVQTPKTIEEKTAFFKWLQEKGIFMETVSISSQTLNALYKEEKKKSDEAGEAWFEIPGITGTTTSSYLSFRKG